MLERASGPEIRSYAGELRIEGDFREAQVLKEYDAVYKLLHDNGVECELQLPPLFKKEFIDRGAVTLQNKNIEDFMVNLNIVLDFLEKSDMFDLLVTGKNGGYKVNSNDPRLPRDIRAALNKCTESFCTTVGQKPVRLRFLDSKKLDPRLAKQIEDKVSASNQSYESWAVKAVNRLKNDRKILAKLFASSFIQLGKNRRYARLFNYLIFMAASCASHIHDSLLHMDGSGRSGKRLASSPKFNRSLFGLIRTIVLYW